MHEIQTITAMSAPSKKNGVGESVNAILPSNPPKPKTAGPLDKA